MIPLDQRICHPALIAQIPGTDGKFPHCIGEQCSEYEACTLKILSSAHQIDELWKHPRAHRVAMGAAWGRA